MDILIGNVSLDNFLIFIFNEQIIQNIIAGILIAVNRPIQLDDWVEISGTGISKFKEEKIDMMQN